MNRKIIVLIITVLLIPVVVRGVFAAQFDHVKFDQILRQHVNSQGRVEYNGIAENPIFNAYITALETADIENMSQNEQLAFWINAYNAVTIDKVIKWKPKKSVRETFIPGIWS